MKIISVAGAESSIGKTYAICRLLPYLSGWAALKITRCSQGKCPRDSDCNVCGSIDTDIKIEEDIKIISQTGTDTCRIMQAKAAKVLWLKVQPEVLKKGIDSSLDLLSPFPGVIIEGNSFLKVHDADLALMIIDGSKKMKPSAICILDKIDLFLKRKDNDFILVNPKNFEKTINCNWIEETIRRLNNV